MKSHLKLIFSFSIGTWINAILSFLLTPIITYLISPEEFGKASMFLLVYSVTLMVTLAGADQAYIIYFFDRTDKERKKLFWNSIYVSLMFFVLIFVTIIAFNTPISKFIFGKYYIQGNVLLIFSLLTGIFQTYVLQSVRMLKKGWHYSLLQISKSISNYLVITMYCLLIAKTFTAILLGQLFANILPVLLSFFLISYLTKPERPNSKEMREILKTGIPFVPNFMLIWLFQSIDRISLRYYTNFNEIGLYTVAFKMSLIINVLQDGFTNYWFPLAYEYHSKKKEETDIYVKANDIATTIFLTMASLIMLSKEIFFMIIAKQYKSAENVFPFLVLGAAVYALYPTTGIGINLTKKTYWHLPISLTAMIFNFVGNTLLVPKLGSIGAAVSTGLSYILFYAVGTLISMKLFPIPYNLKKTFFSIFILLLQAIFETLSNLNFSFKSLSLLFLLILVVINADTMKKLYLKFH